MVEFFQYLGQEWKVIGAAPFTFIIGLFLAAIVIWAIIKGMGAATESALRERISLRDDQLLDYKEKLSGASPDEARRRIEVLEKRIAELEPLTIPQDQQEAMIKALRLVSGQVSIFREMGAATLVKLHNQLSLVLKKAGWNVINGTGMDMNFEPDSKVTVTSPNLTSPQFRVLNEALKLGGIPFNSIVDETYVNKDTGEPILSIKLTEDVVKMDSWSLSA